MSGGFFMLSDIEPESNELRPPTRIGRGMIRNDSFFLLFKKSCPFVFDVVYEKIWTKIQTNAIIGLKFNIGVIK